MPDDVAEEFAKRDEKLFGEFGSNDRVDRTVETDMRRESQDGRRLSDEREHARPTTGEPPFAGAEFEDHAADLSDGRVEVVDGHLDFVGDAEIAGHTGEGLETERRGEEPLDHEVVQVSRDPLAIVEERELLDMLMEASVLDRDPRGARQRNRDGLVACGERTTPLLGEVEIAEDRVTSTDGHAQERSHRRVTGRESDRVRVRLELLEAQRPRVADDEPKDATTARGMPDPECHGGVDSLGDEFGQQDLAVRGRGSKNADRAISGTGLLARDLDDAPHDRLQFQVRRDREHRVENPLYVGHDAKRSLLEHPALAGPLIVIF